MTKTVEEKEKEENKKQYILGDHTKHPDFTRGLIDELTDALK